MYVPWNLKKHIKHLKEIKTKFSAAGIISKESCERSNAVAVLVDKISHTSNYS